MKKIIRLTERDLTRLVKRTVMELDRSTYDKAADDAGEKGYNKLSDRFREHGKEFGTVKEKNKITMDVISNSKKIMATELIMNSLTIDSNLITLNTSSYLGGKTQAIPFTITLHPNKIKFSCLDKYPSLPKTKEDARKVLSFFKDNGVDVSGIDPRSISHDDSEF